jgi:hypothetical protein
MPETIRIDFRSEPRFQLGKLAATPGALERVPHEEIMNALERHVCGDWGTVDEQDWVANNRALFEGTRVLSAYKASEGVTFWVITEADRSSTTILLPEEY